MYDCVCVCVAFLTHYMNQEFSDEDNSQEFIAYTARTDHTRSTCQRKAMKESKVKGFTLVDK